MKEVNSPANTFESKKERDLLKHIVTTSRGYKIWVAFLVCVILFGIFAYYRQVRYGLIVTAMRDYTSWGIYISNFVFFVAISLVGSLFSCILKLNNNTWAEPLTRISEIIAVAAIACATVIIIVDMGRPERLIYVFRYLRIQSPIIWDVIIINTYLSISLLLMYISVLPDIALCRDRLKDVSKWKRTIYRIGAINWVNHPRQFQMLKKVSRLLALVVLPIAFMIHTITSWLFATTWRPGWDSTNLGPYFVSGAFMAGAAMIILVMYVIRNQLKLKEYITDLHFDHMGKLLVLLSLVYLYFNINEYLGPSFKMVGIEGEHIDELFTGKYAPMYWFVQLGGMVIPIILLIFRPFRRPVPIFVISAFVVLGAWLKRYLIVIPSLQHPYLPIQDVEESYLSYIPTLEEWAITWASFASFLFIITVLVKLFPAVPVNEAVESSEVTEIALNSQRNEASS